MSLKVIWEPSDRIVYKVHPDSLSSEVPVVSLSPRRSYSRSFHQRVHSESQGVWTWALNPDAKQMFGDVYRLRFEIERRVRSQFWQSHLQADLWRKRRGRLANWHGQATCMYSILPLKPNVLNLGYTPSPGLNCRPFISSDVVRRDITFGLSWFRRFTGPRSQSGRSYRLTQPSYQRYST